MGHLFTILLVQPLLNLLVIVYNGIIPDLGVAIVLVTLLIRFVLLPLFYKSAKDQTIIQKYVTPKIKEVQKKHKDDKERQVKEMMAVYKEHKVSPFSGFLLIIIQLPILIALYRVFLMDFSKDFSSQLYSFVAAPSTIHITFLGLVNLGAKNFWLVALAAVFQYLQSKLLFTINKNNKTKSKEPAKGQAAMMEAMGKNMVILGPLFTLLILSQFPSAVALYWMMTSVFSVVQQVIINKQLEKNERSKAIIGDAHLSDGV